jgi:glutathione S-transferase
MTMKLYYSPGACSLASDIVLHEAHIPVELVRVDLRTKKTERGDDYVAINPKGYVPALQLDDGELLTENVAVLEYLSTLVPLLLPQHGMAKWHALEMLAFLSAEVHKAFKPLFVPGTSEDARQHARTTIEHRLGLLDEKLGAREFLLADRFTVADAYLYVMLRWAKKFNVTIPKRLAEYEARLTQRKSVREALAAEGLAAAA